MCRMLIELNVPYREKDAAKRLGARWNDARQVWYIENVDNVGAFLRWLPSRYDHLKRKTSGELPPNCSPAPKESKTKKRRKACPEWVRRKRGIKR